MKPLADFFRWLKFKRELVEYVDGLHEFKDPWGADAHFERLLEELQGILDLQNQKKQNPKRTSVGIEVGAGDGHFLNFMLANCGTVDVLEISKKAVSKIKTRMAGVEGRRLRIFRKDAHDFSYGNQVYDLLLLSFVMDYLGFEKFPERFVSLCLRWCESLRPGGTVLIVQPIYNEKDEQRLQMMIKVLVQFGLKGTVKKVIDFHLYKVLVVCLVKH